MVDLSKNATFRPIFSGETVSLILIISLYSLFLDKYIIINVYVGIYSKVNQVVFPLPPIPPIYSPYTVKSQNREFFPQGLASVPPLPSFISFRFITWEIEKMKDDIIILLIVSIGPI